jgi:hypothetical protein
MDAGLCGHAARPRTRNKDAVSGSEDVLRGEYRAWPKDARCEWQAGCARQRLRPEYQKAELIVNATVEGIHHGISMAGRPIGRR